MPHRLASGVLLLLFAAAPAAAQVTPQAALPAGAEAAINAQTEPKRDLKEGKVIRAARIAAAPPSIDGDLNDEVWANAEPATGFVQRDPDNGKPMTEPTRVQVAYDDKYLYVAIACDDSEPGGIRAGLSRRDDLGPTDEIHIAFDPRHDHQTGYMFRTNPSGVQGDASLFNDENSDIDYNAVWDVRTARTPRGWTAEFRIPFSQMRFSTSPDAGQVWGFTSRREVRRKGEEGAWTPRPRG